MAAAWRGGVASPSLWKGGGKVAKRLGIDARTLAKGEGEERAVNLSCFLSNAACRTTFNNCDMYVPLSVGSCANRTMLC